MLDPSDRHAVPPFVSVVIKSYNYARFLPDAIESALAQRDARVEVIVADDASTDTSLAVAEQYAGRVTILSHDRNRGQAGALNTGFAAATGEFVLFLDADDALLPDALASAVAEWSEGVSRVAFRLGLADANLQPSGVLAPKGDPAQADARTTANLYLLNTDPPTSANLYRREAIAPFFPMDEDAWRMGPDVYCNMMCALAGSFVQLDRVLGLYRVHSDNISLVGEVDFSRIRRRLPIEPNMREALRRHGVTEAELPALSPRHFSFRLVSLLWDPAGHPFPKDQRLDLWREGMRSLAGLPLSVRARFALRLSVLALLPKVLAWQVAQASFRRVSRMHRRGGARAT